MSTKAPRYSKLSSTRLGPALDRFMDDDDPLNLLPELALLRALIEDYIVRYDESIQQLDAWYGSFTREHQKEVEAWRAKVDQLGPREKAPPFPVPSTSANRPTNVVDLLSAGKFITEIAAISNRIFEREKLGTISLPMVHMIIERFGMIVEQEVTKGVNDVTTRTRVFTSIEARWRNISIDPRGVRDQGLDALDNEALTRGAGS